MTSFNRMPHPLYELMDEAYATIHRLHTRTELVKYPTGFVELDRVTGGLHPGELIAIASSPSMGKSTLH